MRAGAILHEHGSLQGLTAPSSLAVGVGMVPMSAATALLIFGLLRFGPRPGLKQPRAAAE